MSTPIVATGAAVADRRAKRNVAVLVFAHAILGSQLAINIIVAGLAGALLADDPSLATLPISIVVVGSLLTAPAMSLFMGRYGRRAGFWVAALAGAAAVGALCARAVHRQLRVVHGGIRAAGRLSSGAGVLSFCCSRYRIRVLQAEGDLVGVRRRIVERLARPRDHARDSGHVSAVPYVGAYLAMIVLNVIGAAGLWFLDIPTVHVPWRSCGHGTAARRHRAPAGIRHRGVVRDGGLLRDEPRHDVDSARNGRPRLHARSRGRRRALAYRRDVRAELLHRFGDRARRTAAGHRGRLAAARRMRRDRAQRHRSRPLLPRD